MVEYQSWYFIHLGYCKVLWGCLQCLYDCHTMLEPECAIFTTNIIKLDLKRLEYQSWRFMHLGFCMVLLGLSYFYDGCERCFLRVCAFCGRNTKYFVVVESQHLKLMAWNRTIHKFLRNIKLRIRRRPTVAYFPSFSSTFLFDSYILRIPFSYVFNF